MTSSQAKKSEIDDKYSDDEWIDQSWNKANQGQLREVRWNPLIYGNRLDPEVTS